MKRIKPLVYPLSPIIFFALTVLLIKVGEFKINPHNTHTHFNNYTYNGTEKTWNETGKLEITIKSPLIRNETPTEISYYNQPVAQIFSDDGSLWTITADKGANIKKEHKITLNGHVHLHRPATKTKPETTVKTNTMNYNTLTRMAFCPEPTTIIQPNITITSDSATINVKQNTITNGTNMNVISHQATQKH